MTLADELRAAGLTVVEADGWQTRRRPGSFRPRAVMIHHTASARGRDAPSLRVVTDGRSDLPGPLCHLLISRSGVVHLISQGRANHAGRGAWRDLTGNGDIWGIEVEADGRGEAWSPQRYAATATAAAVLLRSCSRDETWVMGHREWAPGRKTDPEIDMHQFRADTAAVLEHMEDDMPSLDQIREVVRAEVRAEVARLLDTDVADRGPVRNVLHDVHVRTQQTQDTVAQTLSLIKEGRR